MWNKIEEKVLEKYMSEPKDSDIYQDFWKDILADYSADYWKLARAVPFKIDTIGWQLIGRIVDDRAESGCLYPYRHEAHPHLPQMLRNRWQPNTMPR